jgi:probable phosphoglycerate mutase
VRETIVLFCHFGISMAVLGYLTECSPVVLWHRTLTLPSSVTEIVTEERVHGEVSFRMTRLGDISHLESSGEKRSTAGLFPECFTGVDSTDPAVNGTAGTEMVY